ncbi:glycoside hydrolase family 16 protein [Emericellopsis atlantica]|uniref:endo-1,3(4)-beta-glucanase n=1 Tax=Emericellopsis atlantica TaxID=2614577 RepID=A0A9P7ZNM4_9HYPO|nr:glycoside hydrolase family 16 protein [Emericellopsis atlantica]KAG9254870.1 glycoside hydrolase family 16 protein [Emericellopsis atlantica]
MLFDAPTAFGLVGLFAGTVQAQYQLDTFYNSENFFNEFSFFNEPDPTHGFVEYVNQASAFNLGLARNDNGKIHMAADALEVNPANGRKSVRLTSNKVFTHGLVISDIEHMPGSECGVWPAHWLFGDPWPYAGEIDIIEGVNDQSATAVTLHTGPGCTIRNEGSDPTTLLKEADCNAGNANTGCGQQTSNYLNYGTGFNQIGGGVYAMEWTSDFIAVYFFPRDLIPADITSGHPDPSTWGLPTAKFVGSPGCDMDGFFRDNRIIFNTTFCGDWAGSPDVWNNNPVCSAKAPTCNDFVANNPQEYEEAYWTVNSVSVYKNNGTPTTPTPTQTQTFQA